MPDETATIKLNGQELTKNEVEDRLKKLIVTEEISVSIGEKRQKRQYEGNDYFMSTRISIKDLSPFLNRLEVSDELRRKLSGAALSFLVSKVNQMISFMKKTIHIQQEQDGIPNIDYREGEKE